MAIGIILLSFLSLILAICLNFSKKQPMGNTLYVEEVEAETVGVCKGGITYPDCSRSPLIGSDCSDQSTGPDPTYLHNYCYHEADCCKQDAMACCWAERKYCLPKSCGFSQKNGCSNGWGDDFPTGCLNAPVGSDGELPMDRNGNKIGATSTPQPTSQPQPTSAPQPTSPPQPTQVPAPTSARQPTSVPPSNNPFPTQTQIFPTTETFFPTSTPNQSIIPSFSLPKFNLTSINLNFNKQKINEAVAKPLDFFRYLFEEITYYDRLLEQTINDNLKKL